MSLLFPDDLDRAILRLHETGLLARLYKEPKRVELSGSLPIPFQLSVLKEFFAMWLAALAISAAAFGVEIAAALVRVREIWLAVSGVALLAM